MLSISFIIFTIVALGVTSAAPASVTVDSYNFKSLNDKNEYQYDFTQSDGQSRMEQGSFKPDANGVEKFVVTGSYQYLGPDNVQYTVFYTADENGFHPVGAHLPGTNSLNILPEPSFPILGIPANAITSLIG